jgi:hypothetical protein
MPNLIPDWLPWMRPAGRLIWACLVILIGLAIAFYFLRRPKPDRPATWSECMAGAVGTFALMTLAFAVIPHEWITFSDKYLQWNTTKFVFQSHQDIFFLPVHWPFSMNAQAIRDTIAVLIYVVFFGLALKLFSEWQKRGTEPAKAAAPAQSGLSRFGRPLRRSRQAPAPVTTTLGAPSGNGDG